MSAFSCLLTDSQATSTTHQVGKTFRPQKRRLISDEQSNKNVGPFEVRKVVQEINMKGFLN